MSLPTNEHKQVVIAYQKSGYIQEDLPYRTLAFKQKFKNIEQFSHLKQQLINSGTWEVSPPQS